LLTIGLIASLVAALFTFYWTTLRPEQAVEAPTPTPATSDSVPTVEPAIKSEALVSKTESGYIVSVSTKQITIDYIDTYTGSEAELVAREDGVCDSRPTNERCLAGAPVYDRNINPKLRTFYIASNVVINSHRNQPLTIETLKLYEANKDAEGYYGTPFDFTFNDEGEVLTITEQFRP